MRRMINWLSSSGVRRGVLDGSAFNDAQKAQILCLQNAYKRFLSADGALSENSLLSTEVLDPATGKLCASLHPPESSFKLSAWIEQMGDTFPRIYVEDMVTVICAYQASRFSAIEKQAWFRKGYLDEPLQLFCEEFKLWLVLELSQADCGSKTLEDVNRRIVYLQQLISAEEFLPSHEGCSEQPGGACAGKGRTIFWVLVELHRKLTMEVRPLIELEIAQASAREHIEPMLRHCNETVHYGVAYLLYVLNDKVTLPDDFTWDNVSRVVSGPRYREYFETTAGGFLKTLVAEDTKKHAVSNTSAVTLAALSAGAVSGGAAGGAAAAAAMPPTPVSPAAVSGGAAAVAASAVPIPIISPAAAAIPAFAPDLMENNPFWSMKMDVYEALNKPGSGMNTRVLAKSGRSKLETGKTFIVVHFLLAELIYLGRLWQLTYEMAASGGNLLVYGFANTEINDLLTATEKQIKMLEVVLNELHMRANDRYISLYRCNVSGDEKWRSNFKLATGYFKQLMSNLKNFHLCLQAVRAKANAVTFEGRLERAETMFNELIGKIKKQVYRISQITDTPFLMATETETAAGGAGIAGRVDEVSVGRELPSLLGSRMLTDFFRPADLRESGDEVRAETVLAVPRPAGRR